MRICTVVGARPQFIKASLVSKRLGERDVSEMLVHTGQHYDPELSDVFLRELSLPEPAVNLGAGSGSHAVQTGTIMRRLEEYLLDSARPDGMLVYGDTNSTLAASLVAAKLRLPLLHVEAGLRSFNRRMPEEINRVVTDRLSDVLFCPTDAAVANLRREGTGAEVVECGDVMRELLEQALVSPHESADVLPPGLTPGSYCVCTVHRAENTERPDRLRTIFGAIGELDGAVVLPLHHRTRDRMGDIVVPSNVHMIPPVGYMQMVGLVRRARLVLTDSGGLQKEAHWMGVQCVTLRDETEWIETLDGGWNRLAGAERSSIIDAARTVPSRPRTDFGWPSRSSPSELIADRVAAGSLRRY